MKKLVLLCAAVATLCAFAFNSRAGTHTWSGGNTDGRWSVGSNWEGGNPPFANESPLHLIFPATATRRLSTNNIANISIDSMTFDGAAYTIAASGSGTNVSVDSSVGQSYWNIRVNGGTGHTLHSSLGVTLDGTMEALIATNTSLEIRSALRSTNANSGLSKYGPGSITLSPIAANTYDGATTVYDGTLSLKGGFLFFGGFIPVTTVPGPLVIGDANSSHHAWCAVFEMDQISDSSAVTVNDNGELVLADVDDTIGSLTLVGGIVDTSNGTLGLGGNVIALPPAGSEDAGQIYGHLDLGMLSRSFNVSNAASQLYIAAYISGGNFGNAYAGITKLGAGWLVLVSSNSYPGYTTVNEGILSIQSAATLGSTNRGTSIAEGARLDIFKSPVGQEALTLYGNMNTNPLVVFGESNSWAGPVILNGSCVVSGPSSNDRLSLSGGLSGPGTLHKIGAGTIQLSGSDTDSPSGGIEVDSGVVRLSKSSAPIYNALHIGRPGAGIFNYAPASVVLDGDGQIRDDALVAIHYGGRLDLNGNYETLHDLLIDGGSVETGSGVLTIDSSITNVAPILPGAINGHLSIDYTVTIHTETNSALTINADIDSPQNGNAFELQKVGAGRLTFTTANHFRHVTRILDGELELFGQGDLGEPPVLNPSVEQNGLLTLNNMSNSTMRVVLHTNPGHDALHYRGTNIYYSFLLFGGSENIIRAVPNPFETNAHLSIGLRLTDAGLGAGLGGPVIFDGPGTVQITTPPGYLPFTSLYSGSTWLKQGTLWLDHSAGSDCIPHDITIGQDSGPSAVVRSFADEQIGDSARVTVKATGRLDIDGHTETIGALSGNSNGIVRLAAGELIVDGASGASAFDGFMYGVGGRLTKVGASKLTLNGNNNYTGLTKVQGGTLVVNGTQPQSDVSLTSGTLSGAGRVGAITSSISSVEPGVNMGVLTCGGYATNSNFATLRMQVAGPTPGTGYDQLDVLGTVNLKNTALELHLTGTGAVSNQYVIVKNDGAGAVFGNFNGLTNGASLTADGATFQIFYNGGDGNDVVLIQRTTPAAPQMGGVQILGNGTTQITGTGLPNATYNVQATTNLAPPVVWISLGNVNANGVGLIQFIDIDAPNFPMRFYRFGLP